MTTSYDKDVQGYGAVDSKYDVRDYKIVALDDLPVEYSTRKIPVKNQYFESSCVAHALSTVVEFHYHILHQCENPDLLDNPHHQ